MKTTLKRNLLLTLILVSLSILLICIVSGQENIECNGKIIGIRSMGWYPSGIIDTISVEIVITNTNSTLHMLRSIDGLAVRERLDYDGDRMPPGDYGSYWVIRGFLYLDKTEIPAKLIWMNRERLSN